MSFSLCPDCGDTAFEWCPFRFYIALFMRARSRGRHFHRLVMR